MEEGKQYIFITSWPHGKAEIVTLLGFHTNSDLIYITREKGGSDSTCEDFLFELPARKDN